MYSVLKSYGLNGLNGFAVAVEADVSGGLPADVYKRQAQGPAAHPRPLGPCGRGRPASRRRPPRRLQRRFQRVHTGLSLIHISR